MDGEEARVDKSDDVGDDAGDDDALGIQPRAWWDDWIDEEENFGKTGYDYYLDGTTTTSTTTTTTTTTTTLFPPQERSLGDSCITCYGSGSTTAETRNLCEIFCQFLVKFYLTHGSC